MTGTAPMDTDNPPATDASVFAGLPGATAFSDFFLGTAFIDPSFSAVGAVACTATPQHNGFSITQSSRPSLALSNITASATSLTVNTTLTASPFSGTEAMDIATGGAYREYVLSQSEDGGQAAEAIAYVFSFANGADTDYLAFGSWFYDDDRVYVSAAGSETVFGAFGGISETSSAALRPPVSSFTTTATATYRGDAVGHHLLEELEPNAFHGALTLTAEFGSTPMVSGMISGINYARTSPRAARTITLDSADISMASATAGQFSGSTQATFSGNNIAGDWGGQFYGNQAQAVVGTFGVQQSNIAGYIGSFGAKKQQ